MKPKETVGSLMKVLVKTLANYSVVLAPWSDDLGECAASLTKDVWEWLENKKPEERAAVIEALAQTSPQELRADPEVQGELARSFPDAIQRARAEAFIASIPGKVRSTMQRPADRSGRTIPASLIPRCAADVQAFIPSRMPRFAAGDRPPGIGDLQLDELLGTGGFGEVWLAHNPHLPTQQYALKFCLDDRAATSLRAETSLLARLMQQGAPHPGVVPLQHTFLSADPPCLAYEYVAGQTLAQLITRWHRDQGGPTPQQASRVMLRLAEIVASCHQQSPPIVHRDLKPANILVQSTGDDDSASTFRITDFGIGGLASVPGETGNTQRTQRDLFAAAQGSYSALYASPEQIANQRPAPSDDVYSLGVIWWQLLTGDLTSAAPSGTKWKDNLKVKGACASTVALLSDCIESNAKDRPASAVVLAVRLATVVNGVPAAVRHQQAILQGRDVEGFETWEAYQARLESYGPVEVGTVILRQEDYNPDKKEFNLPPAIQWQSFVPPAYQQSERFFVRTHQPEALWDGGQRQSLKTTVSLGNERDLVLGQLRMGDMSVRVDNEEEWKDYRARLVRHKDQAEKKYQQDGADWRAICVVVGGICVICGIISIWLPALRALVLLLPFLLTRAFGNVSALPWSNGSFKHRKWTCYEQGLDCIALVGVTNILSNWLGLGDRRVTLSDGLLEWGFSNPYPAIVVVLAIVCFARSGCLKRSVTGMKVFASVAIVAACGFGMMIGQADIDLAMIAWGWIVPHLMTGMNRSMTLLSDETAFYSCFSEISQAHHYSSKMIETGDRRFQAALSERPEWARQLCAALQQREYCNELYERHKITLETGYSEWLDGLPVPPGS
jgi:serine/threonine protein kinase